MEKYGVIYKITNTKTNESYIGATTKGFNKRYNRSGVGIERVYNLHKYNKESDRNCFNEKLFNGIVKYGFDAFEVDEELDVAYSAEELHELEAKYIEEFDCIKNGYNTRDEHTGDVFNNLSEEKQEAIRQVLREKNLGDKNPMYGKTMSEENKKLLSEKFSGEGNPMYGKPREDMIGELNPMRNPETAKKISGKNNGMAQRVRCVTTGKEFDTVKEAAKFYNCSRTHIGSVCTGDRNYCGKLPDGTKLVWEHID